MAKDKDDKYKRDWGLKDAQKKEAAKQAKLEEERVAHDKRVAEQDAKIEKERKARQLFGVINDRKEALKDIEHKRRGGC